MAGFFYPYKSPQDALAHLGPFADGSVGRGCGISYSDGLQVSVLRRPAGSQPLWLNVLRRHVSAPRAMHRPLAPPSTLQRIEHIFMRAMEMYGESKMQEMKANQAMSQATIGFVDRTMWQPSHAWLLKHKLIADGLGVAADVVGVVAGIIFICTIGPELGAGALIVGGLAAGGSLILAGIDGAVWGLEVSGNEEDAKAIEENHAVQWARIIGTVMTLPDMAVGGVRALKEIGSLPGEVREATALSHAAADAAEAQRLRAAKITHPAKHPGPIQKHLHRANRLATEAQKQAKLAHHASAGLRNARISAVAAYGATPVGAALITGAPPSMILTEAQKRRDAKTLAEHLTPEGGMPRDLRLEMRVSSISHPGHRR